MRLRHISYAECLLENHPCNSYILYMTVREKTMKTYRPPKTAREKAKFHATVVNHPNANIRLAANYIAEAAKAARSGNISEFMTFVSLAQKFAEDVDFCNPERNLR